MARHRFKGKTCAYCASDGASEAPDHIFARGFFPVEERDRLPQVPACRACNQKKAALEHYLLTVLPFGGESAASTKVLNDAVPGRLAKNLKLHRDLATGRQDVRVRRGDQILSSFAIPFDGQRLVALFALIARGLATYHWDITIPADHVARAGMFTRFGEPVIRELFCKRPAAMREGNSALTPFSMRVSRRSMTLASPSGGPAYMAGHCSQAILKPRPNRHPISGRQRAGPDWEVFSISMVPIARPIQERIEYHKSRKSTIFTRR